MADSNWQELVARELGVTLCKWQPVGGGDFAQSYSAVVSTLQANASNAHGLIVGDVIFIKTHANPPPNHFTTEATGLQWLFDTGTVRVPAVLGVSDEIPFLALKWVDETRQPGHPDLKQGERDFGRQLAAMHKSPLVRFGRADQKTTGSLGLPNEPCSSWSEFYSTQRLLPLSQIASARSTFTAKTITDIERVAHRLDEFIDHDAPASLLHGDLWAGNRLIDLQGNSWVIDPACHGGHREFDLAMMRLFGGYLADCFEAYHEAYPLDSGWQERVPLHQLAPLIVHAIKFGSSYVGPTQQALARYL